MISMGHAWNWMAGNPVGAAIIGMCVFVAGCAWLTRRNLAAPRPPRRQLSQEDVWNIAAKYASHSDEELASMIEHEKHFQTLGFRPEEVDIRKRGFDPAFCDQFIGALQAELDRRRNARMGGVTTE